MTFIHEIEGKCGLESEKFIFSFLLIDVIKENEGLLREEKKIYWKFKLKKFKTKNGRLIMQSKCADCGIKKSRFVKEQEAKILLSNLAIKTPLKFYCYMFYFRMYKNEWNRE